jgi:hypothetical protein
MGKHRHVFLFCINSVTVSGVGQFVSDIWRNMKWSPAPTTTHCITLRCTVSTETAIWTVDNSAHTVQVFLIMQQPSASLLLRTRIYLHFSSVICAFPFLLLHLVSWLLLPPTLSLHTSCFSCHIPKPIAFARHRSLDSPSLFHPLLISYSTYLPPPPPRLLLSQYYPTFSSIIELTL